MKDYIIKNLLPKEKEIGDYTYCTTCGGHIAAGECNCIGYNQALHEVKDKIPEIIECLLEEVRKNIDEKIKKALEISDWNTHSALEDLKSIFTTNPKK